MDLSALPLSFVVVAVAEMGDKTQLLTLVLAARYRRPWVVLAGILIATLANHALAASLGALAAGFAGAEAMRWILGVGFLAMAAWALIPDKEEDAPKAAGALGALAATIVAFFLVEMGDKTQIATAGLAAKAGDVIAVTIGSTLGMLAANAPAAFLGDKLLARLPLKLFRALAAALLAGTGLWILLAR